MTENQDQEQMDLPDALALAVQFHKDRIFEPAEELYQAVLDAAPAHPDALHYFGVLNHDRGRSEKGIEMMERSIAFVPDHIEFQNNLGNALSEVGRLEEAESTFRKIISTQPDFIDAYNNLGIVLKDLKRYQEAHDLYRQALDLNPDKVEILNNLGNVLRKLDRNDEAIATFEKAIEVMPYFRDAYQRLARLYVATGQHHQAQALYRRWLEEAPDDPIAQHMGAAVIGDSIPQRATNDYVKETFDGFANSFDKVLENLKYKAPFLVTEAIKTALGPPRKEFNVLDAGSGTGLCGPLVAPYASHLTGVDLSPGMLAKAEGRDAYDALLEGELTGFMTDHPAEYDIIISADTLCYFGALDDVTKAAKGALKDQGYFVFTLEKSDDDASSDDFTLHAHGRYSHKETYVRKVVADAGLSIVSIGHETLRQERAQPVAGLVVMARRSIEPAA